ncbi:MAG: hypothetical protein ACM31C_33270 [Acidobacteriota bacterium]
MKQTAVVAVLLSLSSIALADGEDSPMLGVTLVGAEAARTPDQQRDLAGAGAELAWWHGRFGLAAEGSARWSLDTDGVRAFVLGGSARLRVLDRMVRSLVEPRDCELGLELHAIVERAWWNDGMAAADPTAFGFGAALRLRGGGDAPSSTLLAESRFFVRVTSSRWSTLDSLARTTAPMAAPDRALTVVVGLGASWGSGTPAYAARFKRHPFQSSLLF